MTARDIRVMIVDDSAVLRVVIANAVADTPGMMVAGTAADGVQALKILDAVHPDVITLDVQMPNMDGLTTLDAIFKKRPTPVIMVSSMTSRGAGCTLDAMERGALDYLTKPDYGPKTKDAIRIKLPQMIRAAAGTDVRRLLEQRRVHQKTIAAQPAPKLKSLAERSTEATPSVLASKCIAIGISTGGPPALTTLFQMLKPPMPPIVIVQHMPAGMTQPLAWRLNSLSPLSIMEATNRNYLLPNQVLMAPGGRHLKLLRFGGKVRAMIANDPPVSSHKPSIDVLMKCVVNCFGSDCLGLIMTGMGKDGSNGCGFIRKAGGYVLGQNEATSQVYGMNKVAKESGHVDKEFALHDVARVITNHVQQAWLQPAKV